MAGTCALPPHGNAVDVIITLRRKEKKKKKKSPPAPGVQPIYSREGHKNPQSGKPQNGIHLEEILLSFPP